MSELKDGEMRDEVRVKLELDDSDVERLVKGNSLELKGDGFVVELDTSFHVPMKPVAKEIIDHLTREYLINSNNDNSSQRDNRPSHQRISH